MIRRILTRVTPATTTALTTLAAFKAELNVTGSENDALYGNVIAYCSNEISAWLNGATDEVGDVTIGREAVSEAIYGASGVSELVLGRLPIGDVVSVSEGGSTITRLIDGQPNPAFTYVVNKASGTIWKIGLYSFSGDVITVEYSAGWILPESQNPTLPKAIEDACLRFCKVKLDQVQEGEDLAGPLKGVSVDGVGNFQFGERAGNIGRGLPYEVRNLIERYKAPVIA